MGGVLLSWKQFFGLLGLVGILILVPAGILYPEQLKAIAESIWNLISGLGG